MTRIYKIEEEVPAFDLERALTCIKLIDHFMEIEEQVQGQEVVITDVSFTNSTRNEIEEKEQGQNERIDDYGLQETEQRERRDQESDHNEEEERNQENNNDQQEHRDINVEGESHDNNQSSENGNQESEQNERNEDENQKDEDEADDEEDEKRKAIAKGKRPMSEICKLTFMVPKFSSLQKGETSYKAEEEAKNSPPEEESNQDMYDDDDQDLAILKSLSHFYYNNGYVPSPSSNELHKHIKDSIPNLKIRGEELINKIFTLEDQFKTVRELDGDNPDMPRPVDREIFKLSMSIWGNSEDNVEHNQGAYDENIQYQALTHFLKDFL